MEMQNPKLEWGHQEIAHFVATIEVTAPNALKVVIITSSKGELLIALHCFFLSRRPHAGKLQMRKNQILCSFYFMIGRSTV